MKKNRIKLCVTYFVHLKCFMGFPDSSVGKESACNAGDLGSIPGSGRSTREGIGFSYFCFIDYSKAFAEKAMAPHFSTLAWKTLWTEESGRLQSMGSQKVGHD